MRGPPNNKMSIAIVTIIIPTEIIFGNIPFSLVIQVKYAIIGEKHANIVQPFINAKPYTACHRWADR